jgi:hypothetical protein
LQRDLEIREIHLAETSPVTIEKATAIEAWKFKVSEELVIHRKLQTLMYTTSEEQRQQTMAIEVAKLSDKIF